MYRRLSSSSVDGVLTYLGLILIFLAIHSQVSAVLAIGAISAIYITWPTEEVPPLGVDKRHWVR